MPNTKIVIEESIQEYIKDTILVKRSKTHLFYHIPLMKMDIKITKDRSINDWITRYVHFRHNQFNVIENSIKIKKKK